MCLSHRFLLLAAVFVPALAYSGAKCRIGIADTRQLASAAGLPYPECSPWKDLAVAPANGRLYLRGHLPENVTAAGHHLGQCSGLWFVAEAVRASRYYTEDLQAADAILVDDYCYRSKALGYSHSIARASPPMQRSSLSYELADSLAAVYQLLLELPAWKSSDGSRFSFFWMHPSWRWHNATQESLFNQRLKCELFKNAHFFTTEQAELNVCEGYTSQHITVVPYTSYLAGTLPRPGIAEPQGLRTGKGRPSHRQGAISHGRHLLQPRDASRQLRDRGAARNRRLPRFSPKARRDVLVTFQGTCSPFAGLGAKSTPGKLMRLLVVKALADPPAPDVLVSCSPGRHDEALQLLRRSTFCLLIPGDTQSTRRLTEVIIEGCIPVFMAPPWHAMPWHADLDYGSFSLFFDVSANASMWLGNVTVAKAMVPGERASSAQDVKWWAPDDPRAWQQATVTSIEGVVPRLRALAADATLILEKQRNLKAAAGLFQYRTFLHEAEPGAVDAIVDHLCRSHQAQ